MNYQIEETDEELMQAVVNKDNRAFCILAARYMDKIYFFTHWQLGNRELAEDATQDVFLKLWDKPHLFDSSKGRFKSWLWTVAANYCRDMFRKNKFHHQHEALDSLLDLNPSPDKQAEDNNELQHIIKMINVLPERQKKALYLYVYDELSYKEIAGVMDISADAVESLLSRARGALREFTQPANLNNNNQEIRSDAKN